MPRIFLLGEVLASLADLPPSAQKQHRSTTSLVSRNGTLPDPAFVGSEEGQQALLEALISIYLAVHVASHYVRLADFTAPTDRLPHKVLLGKFFDLLLPELHRNTQAGLTDEKLLAGDVLGVRCTSHRPLRCISAAPTTRGTASWRGIWPPYSVLFSPLIQFMSFR